MRLRSLRTRLVAITTVLAAVGLIIAGIATYAALRSFLLDRVDRTLAGVVVGRGACAHPRRPATAARAGSVRSARPAS